MNRRATLLTLIAMSAPLGLLPQSGTRPQFEAAVVKPNVSGGNLSTWDPDHHGNFKAENTSLKTLISTAYHVPNFMIFGPAWIESMRYDINAKGSPGASDTQVSLMLQSLLEERFHLRVHRATNEMAVFLLETVNGGLKVRPVNPSEPGNDSNFPSGSWSAIAMTGTLADFAGSISSFAGRPVVDRTHIQGTFRLKLWFNNEPESDGPSLIAALREELGLRLRAGRAPVETLVVDDAEKIPAGN